MNLTEWLAKREYPGVQDLRRAPGTAAGAASRRCAGAASIPIGGYAAISPGSP
jgi:hypothetical protein